MRGRTTAPLRALGALLLAFTVSGCSDDDSTSPKFGTIQMRMTDAPAAVDAINLVIREVSIHRGDGDDDEGGWEVLRTDTLDVDLFELRNGVFMTLAAAEVPAGTYTQIRLKLDEGSTIVVDGVTHPLVVPSGLTSGYKLVGNFTVPPDGLLDLALDFDAARSVHLTGSGTWMLKPTVRVMPFSTAGAIKGRVLPEDTATTVYAIQAADTIGSAITLDDGRFQVSVLPAGTYSVAFDPEGAYRDTTLTGVNVIQGAATDVGDVQLTPQ
ncbi:MAG TPA: DUF4382 domain-containing protein [Candidatus Eisenbacteria bacterium]|nr:DUF4382 domain-containing protein [Candidatus Eisenbacteria bacterium]